MYGPYATPQLAVVIGVNIPWLVFPILIIYRMWKSEHPFTLVKKTQELSDGLNEKLIKTEFDPRRLNRLFNKFRYFPMKKWAKSTCE